MAVADASIDIDGVVDHLGPDASLGELGLGHPADGDVPPRRIVGRQLGHVGEPGAVPRGIVVVQDGRAAPQDLGHDARCREVQRDGEQVLHHDQVDGGQCPLQLRPRGRTRRVEPQTGHDVVDRSGAGHRDGAEPEVGQRGAPRVRDDGDTVDTAQTEGDEGCCCARHAPAQPHTSWAVSTTSRSLATCSS